LPIQRSMIEFIRGACIEERRTLTPAAWKTASNAAVKLAPPAETSPAAIPHG